MVNRKTVSVTTGTRLIIFIAVCLFIYVIVSAHLIIHYSLSIKGIVLFLPGIIILSLVFYYVLSWKIMASKNGILISFPFAKNTMMKWDDLENVYTAYSYTNHEIMTLVFRNGKRITVPLRCQNALVFRDMIIAHKSIRVSSHQIL